MAVPFKLIELILIGLAFSMQVQICSLNGQIGLNVTSSAEEVSASGKGLAPVLFQMETVMTAACVDQSHSRNHATWNLVQVGFSRHLTLLPVLRFSLSKPQGPGSISKWTEFNSILTFTISKRRIHSMDCMVNLFPELWPWYNLSPSNLYPTCTSGE